MTLSKYNEADENHILWVCDVKRILGEKNLVDLKALYNDRRRHYHNWDHVLDVLAAVSGLSLSDAGRVIHVLAALFHDAVYVVGAKDNEERSVRVMVEMLGASAIMTAASSLILATASHLRATTENTPERHRDFLDCDLLGLSSDDWQSVLARDWADGHERILAGWTVIEVLSKRRSFLTALLGKPTIFLGKTYGSTREWQARLNIQKLIPVEPNYSQITP